MIEITFESHAVWAVGSCFAALFVLIVDWNIRELIKAYRENQK